MYMILYPSVLLSKYDCDDLCSTDIYCGCVCNPIPKCFQNIFMQCLKSVMRIPVRMEAHAQCLLETSSASVQKV